MVEIKIIIIQRVIEHLPFNKFEKHLVDCHYNEFELTTLNLWGTRVVIIAIIG